MATASAVNGSGSSDWSLFIQCLSYQGSCQVKRRPKILLITQMFSMRWKTAQFIFSQDWATWNIWKGGHPKAQSELSTGRNVLTQCLATVTFVLSCLVEPRQPLGSLISPRSRDIHFGCCRDGWHSLQLQSGSCLHVEEFLHCILPVSFWEGILLINVTGESYRVQHFFAC